MSLFRLDSNFFDTLTLTTHPTRKFVSSSVTGITGAVPVFRDTALGMKEVAVSDEENVNIFISDSAEEWRKVVVDQIRALEEQGNPPTDYEWWVKRYMERTNQAKQSVKRGKEVEILRFEPSIKFTSDTLRKNIVRKSLFPFYRPRYPLACNWAFSNYHTLNFYGGHDSQGKPHNTPQSVLIYPATSSIDAGGVNRVYTYRPTGSFSFEFYINPRYTSEGINGSYHAGTILHMSSSYAVSLISGSSRDSATKTDGFRIMLQLSHSADFAPSTIDPSSSLTRPKDLIFFSDDNRLKLNQWHYVAIRWGGKENQAGSGSFIIDGKNAGNFYIPSASIQQLAFNFPAGQPDALFVGNYYEGTNTQETGDDAYISQFFNPTVARDEGVTSFYPTLLPGDIPEPNSSYYSFTHPLNAEIHEVKIYKRYRQLSEILTASQKGITDVTRETGLDFYVPPFFINDSRRREVLETPFQTKRGYTDDPFNVALSFGVNGHYINLENFTKEFVQNEFPRLYALSASVIAVPTDWKTANQFLYSTGSVRKRNLTILPNDNGKFYPGFGLLAGSGSAATIPSGTTAKYQDDEGRLNLTFITLNDYLNTGSAAFSGIPTGYEGENPGSIAEQLAGPTPLDPSLPAGAVLTIFQRTQDPSSNEVTFFDISNLFYGNRVFPETFSIEDTALTGSGGKIKITLKDNGQGNLYRADCTGSKATWNNIGTLLYQEGLAVVKNPTLAMFGKEGFSTSFTGEQKIHILELNAFCEAGKVNSSSNPTYQALFPSTLPADKNLDFNYVTGILFHDENLNVIAKTNLSQPIIKRDNDRFVFRMKVDF